MRRFKCLEAIHECEAGFVSFLNLFVVLGILLGISLVVNVSLVCRDKLESQNAADAVSQSAGVHGARGMNAVTAANHIIGEAQALVVLHHAWGGDSLERGGMYDHTPGFLRLSLESAYEAALSICPPSLGPQPGDYSRVGSEVRSEAALGDSFVELKKHLLQAYDLHSVGGVLYWNPYTQPTGIAIMQLCLAMEMTIVEEWEILKQAESVAAGELMRYKKTLRDHLIPAFYRYSLLQQRETPGRMGRAAETVGALHSVNASLFPEPSNFADNSALRLPLNPEPVSGFGGNIEKAQLVRASVPWIIHWRAPVVSGSVEKLPLSRFSEHYWRHSQEMSLLLARRAMEKQGIRLLIVDGLKDVDGNKGREIWNRADGSRAADQLFCLMGFTLRSPPPVIGRGIYVNGIEDALLTFSQAMIYNANPTSDKSSSGLQHRTGWDTLNWRHGTIPEWRFGENYRANVPRPQIELNWQAMLVPTTRLNEASLETRGLVRRVLGRTETERAISRTH
jgi:hypothetical protein